MRKKNMMKRILSMVCVVAMLATTFFTNIPSGSKAEAEENVGTQNAESELTYLTLKDFSIASGKISSSTGYGDEQTYAPGFDNTVVSFYANFTSGGPRIHLGGRSDYSREGIIVYIKGSELLVTPNSGCFSGDASRRFDFDVVTVCSKRREEEHELHRESWTFLGGRRGRYAREGGEQNKKIRRRKYVVE